MRTNVIYFPCNNDFLDSKLLLEKYNIDVSNLTYSQQIRELKKFCINKNLDLEILEMKPFTDDSFQEQRTIQLQIRDACACICQINKIRRYERKQKVRKIIKSVIPIIR